MATIITLNIFKLIFYWSNCFTYFLYICFSSNFLHILIAIWIFFLNNFYIIYGNSKFFTSLTIFCSYKKLFRIAKIVGQKHTYSLESHILLLFLLTFNDTNKMFTVHLILCSFKKIMSRKQLELLMVLWI